MRRDVKVIQTKNDEKLKVVKGIYSITITRMSEEGLDSEEGKEPTSPLRNAAISDAVFFCLPVRSTTNVFS